MEIPKNIPDLVKTTEDFDKEDVSYLVSLLEKETLFYQKDKDHSYLIAVTGTSLSHDPKERYVEIEAMDTKYFRSHYSLRMVYSAKNLREACLALINGLN